MKNLVRAVTLLVALLWGTVIVWGAETAAQTADGAQESQMDQAEGRVQVNCGTEGIVKDCTSFPVELQLSQWPAGDYQVVLQTVTNSSMSFELENSLSKLFLTDSNKIDQSKIWRYCREITIGENGEAQVDFQISLPFYGGNFAWTILDQDGQTLASGLATVESPKENEIYTAVLSGETDLDTTLQQMRFAGEDGGTIMNLKTVTWKAEEVPDNLEKLNQLQVFVAEKGQLENLSQEQRVCLERWEDQGGILIETTLETLEKDVEQALSGARLNHLIRENNNSYGGWDKCNVLDSTPIRDTPQVKLYLGLLILYIILAGPGLYLILKRKKRRYYLFGGILVLSLSTVLLLAALGHGDSIHAPFIVYEARYVQNGNDTELQATCGIQAPYNGSYTLYVDPEYQLLPYEPFLSMYWDGGDENIGLPTVEMSLREDTSRLQFSNMSTFQSMYFTVEREYQEGSLVEAQVDCYQETLQGTVTNKSPYVISDVQLLLGKEGVAFLGDLQPGQTVSLETMPLNFVSQESWMEKIEKDFQDQENNWKEYLENQYRQIYYQWGEREEKSQGMILGIVQDGTLDFQMDSGYEIYGKSVLQAKIPVNFTREDTVYDPWFGDRGMNGREEFTTTLGMYIDRGETEGKYQVDGKLERLRFIPVESVKNSYEEPFVGEISLYNWQTEKYDLLENWETRVLEEEELTPYVSPDTNFIQIRYQTEETKKAEDDEVRSMLPMIAVVERKVPDA